MGLNVHTVAIKSEGSPPNDLDRIGLGLFRDLAMPASGASVTSLGSITAGTGFTTIASLTVAPSGGTLTAGVSPTDPAVVTVTSLKAISAVVVAMGLGVAINDTFNLNGGTLAPAGPYGLGGLTAGVAAKLTATHIQVATAVVNAGGTSGTPGAVTVVGTTGTGTKWQGTGVISAGGVLTGPIVVTVNGDYTATPTIAGDTVTGGSLSGATVTLVMGAKTLTVATAGDYQVVPGAGAATTDVVGSGTGVTITGTFGVSQALILHSGNYSGAPSFTITDSGAGTGASIATATLGGSGAVITRRTVGSFPAAYTVMIETIGQDSRQYTVNKSISGFSVAFVGATTLAANTYDALTVS